MSALNTAFIDFKACASELGDYSTISIDTLANSYCNACDLNNEHAKNVYFSALILRFWYKIGKIYNSNKTLGIDINDCFSWLVSAIIMACDKDARVWKTDSNINAQQAINQILTTRFVAAAYYESNLQKNAGKTQALSIDAPVGEEETTSIGELIEDDSYTQADIDTYSIIQGYLNNHKVVEAIILDTIMTKDVFKHEKHLISHKTWDGTIKKIPDYTVEFWPYQLVKELGELNVDYVTRFLNQYSISTNMFMAALETIVKANNQKKYRLISATLKDLKNNLKVVFGN